MLRGLGFRIEDSGWVLRIQGLGYLSRGFGGYTVWGIFQEVIGGYKGISRVLGISGNQTEIHMEQKFCCIGIYLLKPYKDYTRIPFDNLQKSMFTDNQDMNHFLQV